MMQLVSTFADLIRSLFAPLTDLMVRYIPATWLGSLPVLTLLAFAIISLAVGMRYNPFILSLIGVVLAGIEMVVIDSGLYGVSFGGLFVRGAFADFFIYIILIASFLVVLASNSFIGDKGPFHFLLLMSVAGALWIVMATDLVGLFLAWEMMSTPTYALAAMGPKRAAVDGAIKYFVMGLLASMLMLVGIALVYGVAGTVNIAEVAQVVQVYWTNPTLDTSAVATLLLAVVLFVIAFGFKIGVFPGWMWVADTYGSADGTVSAYLAGGTKKAGVGAIMRILFAGFFVARLEWMPLLVGGAIFTMFIGNILALREKNIMRMLAYSSIAMMGYLFIGLAAGTQLGASAAMFHAFVHALMKTSAFILVWALSLRLAKRVTYDDLEGLNKRSPVAAALLAVLMLALSGMPLTAGFWSKLILFASAVEVGMWWLALLGVLNSVISLGYYLRVLKVCYMFEPRSDETIKISRLSLIAVGIGVLGVFVLFIIPGLVLDYATLAAMALIG
ncbi:MAG: NADH-quinone oxidoreductase subunit N [Candidatus Thorarchaeota archaeon]|nr:NADH-quinone oxidoreductase subunit N [Candidatus Thorarchaeota archaeon]